MLWKVPLRKSAITALASARMSLMAKSMMSSSVSLSTVKTT